METFVKPDDETGFPGGANGKEPACLYRRHKTHRFNSWVGKISWRREWQPTPVFWIEFHGQRSLESAIVFGYHKESETIE